MVKTNGHRYGHRMGTVWAPYGHLQILATSGTGAFTHVAICTFRGFVEYRRPQCRRHLNEFRTSRLISGQDAWIGKGLLLERSQESAEARQKHRERTGSNRKCDNDPQIEACGQDDSLLT